MQGLHNVSIGILTAGLALVVGCGQPAKEPLGTASPETDAVPARIAQLEQTVDALRADIALLKSTPVPSIPTVAPPVSTSELARLDTQLQTLYANIVPMIDARIERLVGTQSDIQAILEETVTEEMTRAEKRKEEETRKRMEESLKQWKEQRAKQEEERLAQMVDALSLNVWQQEQTKSALSEYREAKQAAMKETRAQSNPADFSGYREALKKAESDHRDQMAAILSTDQMRDYTNSWQRQVDGGQTIFFGGGGGGNSTISITTSPQWGQ